MRSNKSSLPRAIRTEGGKVEIPEGSRKLYLVMPGELIDEMDTIAQDAGLSRNTYFAALLNDVLHARYRARNPDRNLNALLCPRCGGDSKVKDIRVNRRRRECLKCKARWSTNEIYDASRPTASHPEPGNSES